MKTKVKVFAWTAFAGLVLVALGVGWWIWRFRTYTPVEAMQDLRAAAAVRHAPKPVERFLEIRYGPLTDPANSRRAFLEFFNVGHIEGLYMISRHTPPAMQKANIAAMASWLSHYRSNLPPEEKQALHEYLNSASGRAAIKQATAQYLSKDVHYRALTAPVIAELMTTLAQVQKP